MSSRKVSPMKIAPFQLEQLFFQEISIKALLSYDPDSEEPRDFPKLSIKHSYEDSKHLFMLSLLMDKEENPSNPYAISVTCMAGFVFDPESEIPQDEQEKLIRHSAPNIVFGSIRDQIIAITSRAPWGALHLPPIYIPQEAIEDF